MYLLLLGTLALAQDTTKTDDGFTADQNASKSGDGSQTPPGCFGIQDPDTTTPIDDFRIYERHYTEFLNNLEAPTEPFDNFQMDIGHSTAGIVSVDASGKQQFDSAAEIWTEKGLAIGNVVISRIENWFITDEAIVDEPGATFGLVYKSPQGLQTIEHIVLESDPSLSGTFIEMNVDYMKLPDAKDTAILTYVDENVTRHYFEGTLTTADGNSQTLAYLLREIQYDDQQEETARYDHWIFLDAADGGWKLLNESGERLVMTAQQNAPSLASYYFQFQCGPLADLPVKGGAVVTHAFSTNAESGFFD